jgi:hypothetical protein
VRRTRRTSTWVSTWTCGRRGNRRRVTGRRSRVRTAGRTTRRRPPDVPNDRSGSARATHTRRPTVRWSAVGRQQGVDPDDGGLRHQANHPTSHPARARRARRGARANGARAALPEAERRMADTRVHRAPRFALQPRWIRSGGHNPMGRQAMARPPPSVGSVCAECARSACEVGIVTSETRSRGRSSSRSASRSASRTIARRSRGRKPARRRFTRAGTDGTSARPANR